MPGPFSGRSFRRSKRGWRTWAVIEALGLERLCLREGAALEDDEGGAMAIVRAAEKGEVLTGLLYLSPNAKDLHAHLNTYETRPFNQLAEKDLSPGAGNARED